ncbi:class I SAM-dependent methyltransferase [Spongiactinospora sp. 9N601]|uniref:class I SAM-dependent methyltransferase n=1 Tax=Spongiactinospora sp. 9N601 TaxID=3375149 RepID=UPI0037BA127A
MRSDVTRAHYDRLATSFDENWAYSPDFIAWMTGTIVDRLNLRPTDTVLDLGGGTGLYSRGMAQHAAMVVCADPSSGMLAQLPSDARLAPLHAGAEEIVDAKIRLPHEAYDAILLKEVVHHLDDPARILAGLARLLRPGARILVVMLPTMIDYPLFDAALRLFQQRQPDPEHIAEAMTGAGLRAEVTCEGFPLAFDRERYIDMVRSRYMSLLSSFNDAELEQGVQEILARHPGPEVRFTDRFAFVLGTAP